MTLSEPGKSLAMYSTTELVWLLTPGCGPRGFAREALPLPFATRSCLPSGVTRTEVGYQPTGIKPSERLLPGVLTSKTATTLLSAFATNSMLSSRERARLFGVEPKRASGRSAAQIVSRGFPDSVFRTVTVFRFALATKSVLPDLLRTISHG